MKFTVIIKSGILILLFNSFLTAKAQLPGTPVSSLKEMKNVFGGSGADLAFSVTATADSGYLVTGYTDSNNNDVSGNHGNIDVWVVKLNRKWEIQWQKTLGGSGNEGAASVIQTSDGGYLLAGNTDSSDGDISAYHGGDRNMWIVKLSSTGAIEWEKNYGGSMEDRAHSVIQTTDGGYAVAGFSGSADGDATVNKGSLDVWVVKTDGTGTLQWQKSFGGSGIDIANCIKQTADGGFAISGLSNSNDGDVSGSHGGQDFWVLKLNGTGVLEWQKALGGTGDDGSTSLLQAPDGGYMVAGVSESNNGDISGNHGQEDLWVLKLSSTGSLEWQKPFGGTGNDVAYAIIETNDGKYAIAGASNSNDGNVSGNHGGRDSWVIKINATGTLLEWQKTIGGSLDEQVHSLIQTTDGNYIVAGFSVSETGDIAGPAHGAEDFFISKLDANGNAIRIYDDTVQ